jgi:hypothetical protein
MTTLVFSGAFKIKIPLLMFGTPIQISAWQCCDFTEEIPFEIVIYPCQQGCAIIVLALTWAPALSSKSPL